MTQQSESIPQLVQRLRTYFISSQVTKTYDWRRRQLDALHRLLTENETELTAALKSDLSKPVMEASIAEVVTCAGEVRRAASLLKSWMKPQKVSTPLAAQPGSSMIMREPYGVVLIIVPFNYPVQLVVTPLLAALAAGNAAIIKPSDLTPAVSRAVARLIPRYLDPEAVAVVEGGVPETTALLKEHFDYIFFTGSETVGKIVMRAAAEHLTPVTLELGGKSPVIVDTECNIALAARRVAWGRYYNQGQTCVAPDYVFVHASVKQALLDALCHTIDTFYGDDPQKSPDLGRIVSTRHAQRLAGLIDAHKADVVKGGTYDVESRWVAPTVLDLKTNIAGSIMASEVFGPILGVLEYKELSEVIAYINSKPKPLALYVFSTNTAVQERLLNETSSGGVCINDVMLQSVSPDLPFGGVGSSGMGSYHGKHGFLTFSHSKAVMNRSEWFDAPVRYPPYTDSKINLFRKIVNWS